MRPADVVLPVLRAALPGVSVVTTIPDVDYRDFPLVHLRRAGGTRNPKLPHRASRPVLEITAVSADGPIEAEELFEDALDALYAAVRQQIVVPDAGHLQSLREAQGPTQTASRYPDTWAVEGSVQLSLSA